MNDFWKSSGFQLLDVNDAGRLVVTPDYMRAYYTRPEVHPVEESCSEEIALHDALMADPFLDVSAGRVASLADEDARDSYTIVLGFRDRLVEAGTLEAAYLELIRSRPVTVPPVFLDQMVHAILRNCLSRVTDPIRIRAAEVLFRDQNVSTDDGLIMLADDEIVEMHSANRGLGGIGQLLLESNTPARTVELDVLDEDNKDIYWDRSDRFDTVIDLRFTQPGLDALARVLETWLRHMMGISVRIQPLQRIDDERWTWHIGLDGEATRILNALYEGKQLSLEDSQQIIALYRMTFEDTAMVMPSVGNRPVYLGLARTRAGKCKLKPQNLLMNLPLVQGG